MGTRWTIRCETGLIGLIPLLPNSHGQRLHAGDVRSEGAELVGRRDAEGAEVGGAETTVGGVDFDSADRTGVAVEYLQPGLAATDVQVVVLVERHAVGIGGQAVDPDSLAGELAGADDVVAVDPLAAGVGDVERAVVGRKPHAVRLKADGRYPRDAAVGRAVVNVLLHHGRLAAVLVVGIGEIEPAVEVDRQVVRLVEVLAVDLGAEDAFGGAAGVAFFGASEGDTRTTPLSLWERGRG